jgi:hypothetical protein
MKRGISLSCKNIFGNMLSEKLLHYTEHSSVLCVVYDDDDDDDDDD